MYMHSSQVWYAELVWFKQHPSYVTKDAMLMNDRADL